MGKEAKARSASKQARALGVNVNMLDIPTAAARAGLRPRTVRRRVLQATTGTASMLVVAHAYARVTKQDSVRIDEAITWAQQLPAAERPW